MEFSEQLLLCIWVQMHKQYSLLNKYLKLSFSISLFIKDKFIILLKMLLEVCSNNDKLKN